MMNKFQLVFISTPAIGNLVPTVEFAKHLTNHHPRFSATILLITLAQRPIVNAYVQSCSSTSASCSNVSFVHLPAVDPPLPDRYRSSIAFLSLFLEHHKLHVKNAITKLKQTGSSSDPGRVIGLFLDMFCTCMIDVGNELNVPCYLFMASPASYLGFTFHLPVLDNQLATEFIDSEKGLIVPKDSGTRLLVPSFANPFPPEVLPNAVLKRKDDGYFWYLTHARRYREVKGIVVNTFRELETFAVNSLCKGDLPPVYPVGPVIDVAGPVQWHPDRDKHFGVMKWLDEQPESSVVFLCFGSMGSLGEPQLKEIAVGLEKTGFRFLWSIREPPKNRLDLPGEYRNVEEPLPEGFLDRTAGTGLVCGWVPQVTILAHKAIGGFVSHCGWNSILESIWYGVPIATWPLYAEQQMNAFLLVRELGLAVEIRIDYREGSDLVVAEDIEKGIKRLMKEDDEVRRKVKDMSKMGRMAVDENGSSYIALGSLIEKLTAEIC